MRFSEETIEQVRQAVDLVDLINGHVQLRKAGQTWKGLCPFHSEKTPSFTVNPDRQAYHCFGCGAGGDAFRFVMETEKLPFADAVRALAERYSVTLPQAVEDDRAGVLYRALEDAATFFRRALEDPETGRNARAYLAERGLDKPILEAYNVGLAPPGWEALTQRLGPTYGMAVLSEAGLVVRREKGEGYYDRFRGRILVPLVSPSGRVVGFGGRALGDETPKYLNSPETPVYRKGKFLFGLERARAAFKARDEAILVEGYFDVIALAQAGVEEVVATAGTALTVDQCRLLRRYVPKVLLVFDGDAAGQAAAEKALVPAVLANLSARVVCLPAGEDPDTLVRGGGGRTAWERAVAQAKSPIAFLAQRHAGAREEALRASAKLAAAAEDPITARLLVEEAARALSFDEVALAREVERVRTGQRPRIAPVPVSGARPADSAPRAGGPAPGGAVVRANRNPAQARTRPAGAAWDQATRALETSFLALLVAHPEVRDEAAGHVEPAWFKVADCRALAEQLLAEDARAPEALLADPDLDPAVRGLLSGLLAGARTLEEPRTALADGVTRLKRRALEAERQLLQDELRNALSDAGRPEADPADPGQAAQLATLQIRMQETAAALRALATEAWRKERA